MNKKVGLMFISLCLILSAGLVLINFNQASFKAIAASEKASKSAPSFVSEGVTFDLLAGASTATLAGNVSNQRKYAVSGATVTVSGKELKKDKTAKTGAQGQYSVGGLPEGKYKVEISGKGIKTKKGSVRIRSKDLGEVLIRNYKVRD